MAPKLPRGFGSSNLKSDKVGPSTVKARPSSKKDANRKIPTPVETLKRNAEIPKDPILTKKPRVEGASSHVESLIGPAAAAYIGENEVHSWQNMNAENEIHSMIQASAQLLTQSLGRAQRLQQERMHVSKLEADNKRLAEMVVENDNKWKKDLDAKTAELAVVKEELQESFKHRDLLNGLNDKLEAEKEEMQARIDTLEIEKSDCWGEEKQAMEDRNFQAGFDFYLHGFVSRDPDYDWSKFGPGCAEDIAEFKTKYAAKIKKKRVEFGLEEDSEGAPSAGSVPLNLEQTTTENQEAQSSHHASNPDKKPASEIAQPASTQGASPTTSKGVS